MSNKKLNVPNPKKVFLERAIKFNLDALKQAIQNYRIFFQEVPLFFLDPEPVKIPQKLLTNCIVVSDRSLALDYVPKAAIVAEIGTAQGNFAKSILKTVQPSCLHVIDIQFDLFDFNELNKSINDKKLVTHKGLSWEILESFEDDYFDFIYVDAGHTYDQVLKDLKVSMKKIKKGGIIGCNDYCLWSPLDAMHFGVVAAVNEVAVEFNLQFICFCLQKFGYYDVFLRVVEK